MLNSRIFHLLDLESIRHMTKLRIMSVRFSTPVTMSELPKFRGAVIASAGHKNDLFHNHQNEGFSYRYPLLQYRIMGGNAGLVCLNEGIEQMQNLLGSEFLLRPIEFAGRSEQVVVEDMRINELELCFLEQPVCYHISHWLPFNQENYRQWQELSTDEERLTRLNSLLVGNIISFAKGVGWQLDERVEVNIDASTIASRYIYHKAKRLIAVSADFEANILLPRGIALGKGVSLNKGIVTTQK